MTACAAAAARPPASQPAPLPRMARPPFDSAGRVGVQPAAQLGHVQGHGHVGHVLRALRACPGPQALSRAFPVHARLRRRRATASRLPARTPPPPYRMPSFSTRQRTSAFNQPLSFNTSKVTNMNYMFWVRSARALAPKP
jgi:hypothetical protein